MKKMHRIGFRSKYSMPEPIGARTVIFETQDSTSRAKDFKGRSQNFKNPRPGIRKNQSVSRLTARSSGG